MLPDRIGVSFRDMTSSKNREFVSSVLDVVPVEVHPSTAPDADLCDYICTFWSGKHRKDKRCQGLIRFGFLGLAARRLVLYFHLNSFNNEVNQIAMRNRKDLRGNICSATFLWVSCLCLGFSATPEPYSHHRTWFCLSTWSWVAWQASEVQEFKQNSNHLQDRFQPANRCRRKPDFKFSGCFFSLVQLDSTLSKLSRDRTEPLCFPTSDPDTFHKLQLDYPHSRTSRFSYFETQETFVTFPFLGIDDFITNIQPRPPIGSRPLDLQQKISSEVLCVYLPLSCDAALGNVLWLGLRRKLFSGANQKL